MKKKEKQKEMIHELSVLIQGFACIIITLLVLIVHVPFPSNMVYINIYDSFLFKMIVIETLTYFERILINYMISKPMVVNYIYYDLKYLCHACTNTFNAHVDLLECYFLPFMRTGFYFQPSMWKKLKLNMIIW